MLEIELNKISEKIDWMLNYKIQTFPEKSQNMDAEQYQEDFPKFYEIIIKEIQKLGYLTEKYGHSKQLDELKDRAYDLIGLYSKLKNNV